MMVSTDRRLREEGRGPSPSCKGLQLLVTCGEDGASESRESEGVWAEGAEGIWRSRE